MDRSRTHTHQCPTGSPSLCPDSKQSRKAIAAVQAHCFVSQGLCTLGKDVLFGICDLMTEQLNLDHPKLCIRWNFTRCKWHVNETQGNPAVFHGFTLVGYSPTVHCYLKWLLLSQQSSTTGSWAPKMTEVVHPCRMEGSVAFPKDVALKIGTTLIQSALQLAKDGVLPRTPHSIVSTPTRMLWLMLLASAQLGCTLTPRQTRHANTMSSGQSNQHTNLYSSCIKVAVLSLVTF